MNSVIFGPFLFITSLFRPREYLIFLYNMSLFLYIRIKCFRMNYVRPQSLLNPQMSILKPLKNGLKHKPNFSYFEKTRDVKENPFWLLSVTNSARSVHSVRIQICSSDSESRPIWEIKKVKQCVFFRTIQKNQHVLYIYIGELGINHSQSSHGC